ncbi:MAG TPA: PEP-CTERM sorting domain-containing protein, partial [Rhodocyclaceae bacterium]|nr:PEP-CTERM sorting domain-containing protein [Rhodocyclaceae bacterium]
PLTLNNPGANSYGAGDFAIDFGKNGSFDLGINYKFVAGAGGVLEGFGIQGGVYASPTWAYGLWNAAGAQVAAINADKNHPTSLTGGTLIGSAAMAFTTVGANNYGQWAADQHYFYELSVDTALLMAAGWDGHSSFNVHWTQNCANDSILVGTPTYVPEPVSLALMPLGLLGLAVGRRRQKAARA